VKRAWFWWTYPSGRAGVHVYLVAQDGRVYSPSGDFVGTVAEINRCTGYGLAYKTALRCAARAWWLKEQARTLAAERGMP
jgi:hypothetical protein